MVPLACRPYPACFAQPFPEVALAGWQAECSQWSLEERRPRCGVAGVREPGTRRETAMTGEQDMFDAIVMADERFHREGYQEGYEEGSTLGISEGRQCGTVHGAKIGSEIGCYRGFALAWKCLLHSGTDEKDRKTKVLETLIGLLQDFPYDDPTYERLHEDLDRIRGKFKQLCSLLNVQPDFRITAAGPALSF